MSATGRSDVRQADDFYSTPAWCTRAILSHLAIAGCVLDPCAGTGAILRAIFESNTTRALFHGYELDPGRALDARTQGLHVVARDALDDSPWSEIRPVKGIHGTVITNPPFRLALAFVERALSEIGTGADGMRCGTAAFLLRLNWLEGQARAPFHRKNPADVFVLPRRPSFTGKGTDATAYAWFVWGPGRGGRWQILNLEGVS